MQIWQLRRKIHSSWLIACASISVVAGTALVPHINQTFFSSVVWLFAGLLICGVVIWQRFVLLVPLIIIAGLLIGLWRGSTLASQLVIYKNFIDHSVIVTGTVSDDPDTGQDKALALRLSNIAVEGHQEPGKIWASTHTTADIKRGDTVQLRGTIGAGFGSYSGVMYEAKTMKVERPQPGDVARQVRDWFADKIRLTISEPQASLGLGYLLGQKRSLPDDLQQALVVTGLTHVVVASGYNLTILVRLARRLFVRVSKYLATLAASTMILAFIAVTGASPSMTRAGLVSGLSLAAWYYGRKFHPLVLLPFAAALTVVVDPTYAWNDLGWQLSFAAFAGVMVLAPLLQAYFFGSKKPGIVRQILGETVSAHIVTLPILVLAFGQFSNVAIITNLLVLPLVPLAMLLTFIAGAGVIVVPPLAPVIGLPAQVVLTYMTTVIHYFAELSWAQSIVTIMPWVAALAYVLIVGICVYLWRVTKLNLRDANLVE